MYKTIVVGTDFSDTAAKAVEQAKTLAGLFSAKLHIVTAYRPTSTMASSSLEVMAYGGVELVQEAEGKLAEEIKARLARLSQDIQTSDVAVETHGSPGDPADMILDVAERSNADLIVVGNRGMSGVARFVLGSVSNKITHHAPCSVLVVHTAD